MKSKIAAVVLLSALGFGVTRQAHANAALAIDSNQGTRYGYGYDYPTMRKAEQKALKECGRGCSIVLRFRTGCGAYAADQTPGGTVNGTGTAGDSESAQDRALDQCRDRGGVECSVRVWACNSE